MSDFVLDASAGLALFLPAVKEQRDYADKVFSLIRNGAEPAVPSIWVVEMAAPCSSPAAQGASAAPAIVPRSIPSMSCPRSFTILPTPSAI